MNQPVGRFLLPLLMNLDRAQFDAVIVHGLWQYSSFGVWRALAGTDTPYFVFPHGMLDPWFKRTYPAKHFKKLLYWPWAEYRVLRDAAAVLFTSEEERRLARESFALYRAREVVVNYGTAAPRNLERAREVRRARAVNVRVAEHLAPDAHPLVIAHRRCSLIRSVTASGRSRLAM